MSPALNVLYEDNHLLVVNKPAHVATQGAADGRSSVIELAKLYVRRKYQKPGNVYLGVVSRLDALVTGVLVLARTSKAAARLTEQFRRRSVKKIYWTIVSGHLSNPDGELLDWVVKNEGLHKMCIAHPESAGSREARLRYQTLADSNDRTVLQVELQTGRKHQIRLQLAHLGHPILGDKKYGSTRRFAGGIALHARTLVLEHPVRREPMQFTAPLPDAWRDAGFGEQRLT